MNGITISQIETGDDIEAVRGLVREFMDYALSLEPGAASAQAFEGLEAQLAALPGIFGPPGGAFLLARIDEAPAGCVAFFRHDDAICEVKRMFVRPTFRGHALGARLTEALIARARALGYSRMILSTHHKLEAAQAVYAKAGFTPCAPIYDLPDDEREVVVFMHMVL